MTTEALIPIHFFFVPSNAFDTIDKSYFAKKIQIERDNIVLHVTSIQYNSDSTNRCNFTSKHNLYFLPLFSNFALILYNSLKLIFFSYFFTVHRHVVLPKELVRLIPKTHLMSESEWRAIGVQQSRGWVHYMIHTPEPHILLFRRPITKAE